LQGLHKLRKKTDYTLSDELDHKEIMTVIAEVEKLLSK